MKKPKLNDYGISKDDYAQFLESEEIKKKKEKYNLKRALILSLCYTIIFTLLKFATQSFINSMLETNFLVDLQLLEVISWFFGFFILSLIAQKIRKTSLKIDIENIENKLSNKKLTMLKKYQKDITDYENQKNTLLINIELLYNKLQMIENQNFYNLNSKYLIHFIGFIHEEFDNSDFPIFDFKYKDSYIKCVGIDDFISKVEINEMMNTLNKSNCSEIIIYSICDSIDVELLKQYNAIKYITKEELAQQSKEKINEMIKKETLFDFQKEDENIYNYELYELIQKLDNGLPLGSNSQKIYDEFCLAFNWDETQRDNFGFRGKPLYARNADTERKRDVWFISHSNLTDSIAESGEHLNMIEENFITEYYTNSYKDIYPLNERIVFAKQNGSYKFLGVYAPINPNSKNIERKFKKTSNTYPIE